MSDTRENILMTALRLFARDGYEAVSVSTIAGELGMTKGALYKHYKNKRDIFDNIVERMYQIDAKRANDYEMPAEQYDSMPDSYKNVSLEDIQKFTIEQLKFWTEDDFASKFRRMLSLEQYRNAEMAELYSQCIVAGPVAYMEDVFRELINMGVLKEENPRQLAVEYYAPLFLLINLYDKTGENEELIEILKNHISHFSKHYVMDKKGEEMNTNNMIIRLEKKEEYREVENMVRESFWNVYRPGCLEHYVLNQLRNDPAFVPELDFVMEQDGKLIGQNMFMRANIKADDGRDIPIMTMGPICITPKLKRKGYGKVLLDYSLEKAKELGCGAVCFEGNIDFYGKSGFVPASIFGIRYHGLPEGEDASFFLCKELIPGYLDGITGEYATPQGYFVDEAEAEAFDQEFPVKEKLKLPGQLF